MMITVDVSQSTHQSGGIERYVRETQWYSTELLFAMCWDGLSA